MIQKNNVYNIDCLAGIKMMIEQGLKVDLIVTDPPYLIKSTKAGGKSQLARSIQPMNDELSAANLVFGITEEHLEAMWAVMKTPNIYIWCNGAQIPQYINFFVHNKGCKMEILIWHKTNATPLFCNKYLSDKEYCLYFRKGGYCQPKEYYTAKTVYELPINIKDKKLYGHPTIKPLSIIKNIVENSSKENAIVLDPFSGSGTTAVACTQLERNFICFEINKDYYEASLNRLASVIKEN